MCTVKQRLSDAGLIPLLEEFEMVTRTANHPLAAMVSLDKICTLTRIDKNPGLQSELLSYVVHSIFEDLK